MARPSKRARGDLASANLNPGPAASVGSSDSLADREPGLAVDPMPGQVPAGKESPPRARGIAPFRPKDAG